MTTKTDVLEAITKAMIEIGLEPYDFHITHEPPVQQRLHAGHHEDDGSLVIRLNNSTAVKMLCDRLAR